MLIIGLKNGREIKIKASKVETSKGSLFGDLQNLNWTYEEKETLRLMHIDLDEVIYVLFDTEKEEIVD